MAAAELEQLEIAGGSPSRQAGSGSSASHKHSSSPGSSRRQHGASSQEHDLHRSGGEAECTDGGLLEKGARDERDESSHGEGEDEDEDEDEEDFHPSRLFQRVKSESSRENMLKDKDHSQSWLNTSVCGRSFLVDKKKLQCVVFSMIMYVLMEVVSWYLLLQSDPGDQCRP